MPVGIGTICFACKHLRRGETGESDDGAPTAVCAAYPDGIPLEIWKGGFDHRQEYGGEADGLRFELDTSDDEADELLAWYEDEVLPLRERLEQRDQS